MNHRSSEHHHHHHHHHHNKHHHHHANATENYQVHVSTYDFMPRRFIEAPPYPNIYTTSHIDEARVRPEAHHKKAMVEDYDQRAIEYGRDRNEKVVEEEDIDAEADEFIKREHKRFEMIKWKSMNKG
ncbi:hypothetical protein ACSBR1_036868 [Camellia fascicularis]